MQVFVLPQGHDTPTRRWSSIQSREFGNLHASLAILVLNCDVSKYRREGERLQQNSK